ncbi:hypothetical protein [Synechococcus sp. CS-1325]|uniref:hypothetical protein n=1 Tax=Synechococcus sp. CS-1325 TaxID=2847979 RepID=UPI00223BA704|nr:hypothetical protein [Synechococcus sp. CS-1325]
MAQTGSGGFVWIVVGFAVASFQPLLALTQQEWMWSGGLIELAVLSAALLGAAWLVARRRD